ncbi:MAG: hypothetical protein K2P81_01470 [Bacteriovoracaceae bacterium]|nr:hypothetical protein [Bacteriovoracaceae bacterium]
MFILKYLIKEISILFLILTSMPGNAADLPEICSEFVKNPTKFMPIKVQSNNGKDRFSFNSKSQETTLVCSYEDSGGTCQTDTLSCAGGYINTKSDGLYFGLNEIAVSYSGRLFNFLGRSPKRLDGVETIGEISKKGTFVLCDIQQEVININYSESNHPICEALITGKGIERLKLESVNGKIDLQRSGSEVRYVKENRDTGAGCGCSEVVVYAQSKDEVNSDFIKAFNRLVGKESACSNVKIHQEVSVVRFNKNDFLALDNPSFQIGKIIDENKQIGPQVIYEWRNGRFEKICSSTIITKLKAIPANLE